MQNPPPIPLLLNPHAGALYRKRFHQWLSSHQSEYNVVLTNNALEARSFAADFAAKGYPAVAVAGGDGTLMNAAYGLIGTQTALGILPCGSVNVFSRELGIGSHDYERAHQVLRGERTEEVDLFTLNGRAFLQMAGIGPDAAVIKQITPRMKKIMGPSAHVVAGLKILKTAPTRLFLSLDGGEVLCGSQIIFGNGSRYGGETHLFQDALYNDGLLDAAVIQHSHIGVLREILFSMLQQGTSVDTAGQGMEIRRFRRAVVWAESAVPYQLDGDYAGDIPAGEKMVIERLPQRLRVCVPDTPPVNKPFAHLLTTSVVTRLFRKIGEMRADK